MLKEKNLRTRRLFRNNGRSLVIAMDHARVFDTVTGLKNIAEVVKAVRAGGADSILTPWGSTVAAAEALDGEAAGSASMSHLKVSPAPWKWHCVWV